MDDVGADGNENKRNIGMIITLTTLVMATHEHLKDIQCGTSEKGSLDFYYCAEKKLFLFFTALRQCEIIIFKTRAMNSMAVIQIYKREKKVNKRRSQKGIGLKKINFPLFLNINNTMGILRRREMENNNDNLIGKVNSVSFTV